MTWHIQSPGIVRTVYSSIFKDIQGYSGYLEIFSIFHAYSATLTSMQLGGEWGRPPLPKKFKNEKS